MDVECAELFHIVLVVCIQMDTRRHSRLSILTTASILFTHCMLVLQVLPTTVDKETVMGIYCTL